MDYEQKYKEALERAKKVHKYSSDLAEIKRMEEIFPELRESEDEKIRNEIIIYIGAKNDISLNTHNRWLAWLEKQGEQKKSYDTCDSSMMDNKKSPYGEKRDFGYFEEKSDDTVKPKFKVGDWISTDKNHIWLIDEDCSTTGYSYRLISQNGKVEVGDYNIVDEHSHLWSIKDAKDGDVLFQDLMDGKTFIYNGINPDMAILYSFIISNDGKDVLPYHIGKPNIGIGNIEENKNIIYPATKEQRELLFQKMNDAGYTFNFEKKELKKIHIIDEGKAEMDHCFTKMMNGENVSSTWSEEDENILEDIEEAIINYWHGDTQDILLNWLKFLKQRIEG